MEPLLFCGFLQKQRFYTLFSFLSKCSTLYLVIIFCIYVIPFCGRFPLCLLCSFLRRPCARTGAAPFCLFDNTDGSAPAVILNTKFLRHMFLFVLKWQ